MKIKFLLSALIFIPAVMLSAVASAEVIPGTQLSVDFHSGQVVGSGRNINMIRIPVTDIGTGETTLYDAVFKFTFLPSTGFVFEQISSVAISQPVSIANITPGLYKAQDQLCYSVEGPSLLNDSRSLYTIRGGVSGTGCSPSAEDFTAQFISGLAAGHPDIGTRDIVPNLTSNWVYGFISDNASFNSSHPINDNWQQNELIGLRQSGEQLIIGLFSEGVNNNGSPIDFKEPVESAILTRVNN